MIEMVKVDNIQLVHDRLISRWDPRTGNRVVLLEYRDAKCATRNCKLPPRAVNRLEGINIDPIEVILCGACEGNIKNYISYVKEKYDGRVAETDQVE